MEKIKFDFDVPQDPYVEVYDPDGELVIRTNDDKVFLKIYMIGIMIGLIKIKKNLD